MAGTAQYRMNSIAQLAFKPVATEFAIRLHVSNGRFYGTVEFDLGVQAVGDAPASGLNAVF